MLLDAGLILRAVKFQEAIDMVNKILQLGVDFIKGHGLFSYGFGSFHIVDPDNLSGGFGLGVIAINLILRFYRFS